MVTHDIQTTWEPCLSLSGPLACTITSLQCLCTWASLYQATVGTLLWLLLDSAHATINALELLYLGLPCQVIESSLWYSAYNLPSHCSSGGSASSVLVQQHCSKMLAKIHVIPLSLYAL